jgi:hypothetical protein
VLLAPAHQLLAAETRVGAQHDLHREPALADLRHDALDFFACTGRPVDVRATQLRAQQMLTREDVQRQVTITIVVAVKEPSFLMPVQRIISRVQIED